MWRYSGNGSTEHQTVAKPGIVPAITTRTEHHQFYGLNNKKKSPKTLCEMKRKVENWNGKNKNIVFDMNIIKDFNFHWLWEWSWKNIGSQFPISAVDY